MLEFCFNSAWNYVLGVCASLSANGLTALSGADKLPFEGLIVDSILNSVDSHLETQDKERQHIFHKIRAVVEMNRLRVFTAYVSAVGEAPDWGRPLGEEAKKDIAGTLLPFLPRNDKRYEAALLSILGRAHQFHAANLSPSDHNNILFEILNSINAIQKALFQSQPLTAAQCTNRYEEAYRDITGVLTDGQTAAEEFSSEFQRAVMHTKSVIEKVTEDQYEILYKTRHTRKIAFSGCAGSGKTLVATEKAIRFDKTGLDVLLLCHSPRLAEKLKGYTEETNITTLCFLEWLHILVGKPWFDSGPWSHLQEPTEDLVNAAFDAVGADKYDAIIVDEGQDFRTHWWALVESMLKSPKESFLNIFYDDQQKLVVNDLKFPVVLHEKRLSRNCRNGGNIFAFVRTFHPMVEADARLAGLGSFQAYPTHGVSNTQLGEILADMKPEQRADLITLTTEEGFASESALAGMQVELPPAFSWQEFIIEFIRPQQSPAIGCMTHYVRPREFRGDVQTLAASIGLSSESLPTSADLERISRLVTDDFGPISRLPKMSYSLVPRGRKLDIQGPERSSGVARFLGSGEWADYLPALETFTLTPDASPQPGSNSIPLYTVDSFKGLEHDHILLVAPHVDGGTDTKTYIGASRAKCSLTFLFHPTIAGQLPRAASPLLGI